jgi:hypothetical protein
VEARRNGKVKADGTVKDGNSEWHRLGERLSCELADTVLVISSSIILIISSGKN